MKDPWWRRLGQMLPVRTGKKKQSQLELGMIKGIVRGIMSTREDELTCGECYQLVGRFAESTLAGADPAQAMPHVQNHLDRCDDCREEFRALLDALRAIA